jgi:hypothetical protein
VLLTSAFLCDFAEVREGMLFALAGGISRLWRPTYPALLNVFLATLVELDAEELDRPHEFRVNVLDQDERVVSFTVGGFNLGNVTDRAPGESVTVPIVIDLRGAALPGPGAYTVDVRFSGESMRRLGLRALEGMPPGISVY